MYIPRAIGIPFRHAVLQEDDKQYLHANALTM